MKFTRELQDAAFFLVPWVLVIFILQCFVNYISEP
jgi:hypothetical protein